jgi:hypothetical protein
MAIDKKFYVYVIYDPRPDKNNCPVYVGKGYGRRVYMHMRGSHNKHLNNMLRLCGELGLKIRIRKEYVESEDVAFAREKELIAEFGRHDLNTGTLYNFTDGGEGATGINHEERLAKADRIRKLNADPEFVKRNAESGSAALRKLHADLEFARKHSERSSEHMYKLHADLEFARRHSERGLEQMRKIHANPESKKKIAEQAKINGSAQSQVERVCPACNRVGRGNRWKNHITTLKCQEVR